MQRSKRDIQEENELLKQDIEKYKNDIREREAEKTGLTDDLTEYSRHLERTEDECSSLRKIKKDSDKEIIRLKNEIASLTDVRKVLDEIKRCITISNKVLEDENNNLKIEIDRLNSHSQILQSNIYKMGDEINHTRYLEGKVDAYEKISMLNNSTSLSPLQGE